jgi:DNA replication protein DnaC
LPVEHWHEMIGDATFGDAILDRLVHHAHRLTLTGGSLRRLAPSTKSSGTPTD